MLLVAVGIGSAIGYLNWRYMDNSRSADFTDEQRMAANKEVTQVLLEKTDDWDEEVVICIVDSKFQGLFEDEADYTVSVYILNQESFVKGHVADSTYTIDTLWGYSKSGPNKDPYASMIKVASYTMSRNEKSGEILSFDLKQQVKY